MCTGARVRALPVNDGVRTTRGGGGRAAGASEFSAKHILLETAREGGDALFPTNTKPARFFCVDVASPHASGRTWRRCVKKGGGAGGAGRGHTACGRFPEMGGAQGEPILRHARPGLPTPAFPHRTRARVAKTVTNAMEPVAALVPPAAGAARGGGRTALGKPAGFLAPAAAAGRGSIATAAWAPPRVRPAPAHPALESEGGNLAVRVGSGSARRRPTTPRLTHSLAFPPPLPPSPPLAFRPAGSLSGLTSFFGEPRLSRPRPLPPPPPGRHTTPPGLPARQGVTT